MKKALGVNGVDFSNQKIADEITIMTEESDRLKKEPRPGKGWIAAILRRHREIGDAEYILSCWLRSRHEKLADDPSQD